MRNTILSAAALALALASPAAAQLPQPSAAATGMGDSYTAVARGFSATAWNPANLALAGNPRASLALLGVGASAGVGPVTPGDLAEFDGRAVPAETRRAWLERARAEGGEQGSAGADVTLLAANLGRFGFQLGTSVYTLANLAPDAVELVLFGNAGLTGQPRDFTTLGSRLDAAATSTGAVSYAHPIRVGGEGRLALGATVKYTTGHALFTGRDAGTRITAAPLDVEVRFPVIRSDDADADLGHGWGVDLGAAWELRKWSAGLSVRNVANTFEWDESKLLYDDGITGFEPDDEEDGSDELRPATEAPAELRQHLADLTFSPVLSAGAAFRPSPRVLLSADVRSHTGDGMRSEPKTQLGVGTELRFIPHLPLRAGVAAVAGGYKVSGGLGLELGPVNLTAGGALRDDEFGSGSSAMILLSFGGR